MNIVNPKFEIIEQEAGISGVYKMIEMAGRTCYQSGDRISAASAKGFVERMIKSGHLSMLEHGAVYLTIERWRLSRHEYNAVQKYQDLANGTYVKVKTVDEYYSEDRTSTIDYVSTNLRVLVEHGWMDDLKYLSNPTKYHDRRVCVKFTSDIHFYKDVTRHRVMSWAIESTRFCNYLKKKKFGSSISFIKPCWLKPEEEEDFKKDLELVESLYFKWLGKGWKPEEAAFFLIQGSKAEIVMSGFVSDFKHFFDLRSALHTTGRPHPTVEELVEPLRQEFIKRKYIVYNPNNKSNQL